MSSDQFIRIGKIIGPHGLDGRLKVYAITDFAERFDRGSQIYIRLGSEFRPFVIEASSLLKGLQYLVAIAAIRDRDQAQALKGAELFIDRRQAEETRDSLDEDSFLYADLVDCAVFRDGVFFGTVSTILTAGSGEILVIKNGSGKEFLVPFVRSMVDTAEIGERRLTIHPIEGLFDED